MINVTWTRHWLGLHHSQPSHVRSRHVSGHQSKRFCGDLISSFHWWCVCQAFWPRNMYTMSRSILNTSVIKQLSLVWFMGRTIAHVLDILMNVCKMPVPGMYLTHATEAGVGVVVVGGGGGVYWLCDGRGNSPPVPHSPTPLLPLMLCWDDSWQTILATVSPSAWIHVGPTPLGVDWLYRHQAQPLIQGYRLNITREEHDLKLPLYSTAEFPNSNWPAYKDAQENIKDSLYIM